MSAIELRALRKSFGDVEVLKGISLEVGDGEMVALLGPSGCGKSTTLFLLAGLYQPTSGEILFGGKDVAAVHPRDRNVGLVFQSYALYPNMTVRENIGFPLRLRRLKRAEIERRVQEVAALTQLEPLLDRRPGQLSGGQQQRVAAARAIVKRPALLLLDEPLSNLDIELRAAMRREIKRIQRETRITTVIVTHDQAEAMSLADRIFVLNQGLIQQVGDHRALYEQPATRFVAGFIGTPAMNFIDDLTVIEQGRSGGASWLHGSGERLLPLSSGPLRHALDRGREQVLGIRPEHVGLRPSAAGGLRARVIDVVPEGRDAVVTVELGPLRLRSVVPSTLEIAVDQVVGLALDEAHVHLFDRASGQASFHGSYGRRAA